MSCVVQMHYEESNLIDSSWVPNVAKDETTFLVTLKTDACAITTPLHS
jgi:hypothetical protein